MGSSLGDEVRGGMAGHNLQDHSQDFGFHSVKENARDGLKQNITIQIFKSIAPVAVLRRDNEEWVTG